MPATAASAHDSVSATSLTQQVLNMSTSTRNSDLDDALEELQYTLEQVRLCNKKQHKYAGELRALIAELQEDTEKLEIAAADISPLPPEVKAALKEASRTQRTLNREAITIEKKEAEQSPPPETQRTTKAENSVSPKIKLKPVDVPTFDGDAIQYRLFRNAFRENIENNKDLTNTSRWIHLRRCLTGEAADLVKNMPETVENLEAALNILEDTYGHPGKVTLHLFQQVYQLPNATAEGVSLRRTQAQLEGLLRSLENAGHPVNTDPHLRLIVAGKFPHEVIHHIIQGKIVPLAELREQLNSYITARESVSTQMLSWTNAAAIPSTSQKRTSPAAKATKNTTQRPIQCIFCKGEHWSDTCPKYTTIESRTQQIPDRCVKCFRTKHEGNCTSERRCVYCDQKDHHRALCPKKFGKQITLHTNVQASADTDGVFWTLLLQVSSAHMSAPRTVRAVIDTGGAKSIISDDLARSLGLLTEKQAPIQLQSLGNTALPPAKKAADMLRVHAADGTEIHLQTYVTSAIADDLPAPSVRRFREQYPQFAETLIPETGAGTKIDLLFGKDSLITILTLAKSIAVSDTHQLLATKFGWLIISPEAEQCAQKPHSQLSFHPTMNNDLHNLWELDKLGLTYVQSKQIDAENEALQKFYSTIEFRDGRYYIELPFVQNPPLLDENFGLAFGRLKTLWNKLKKHPDLLVAYDEIINQQEREQIVEKVPRRSVNEGAIVHYIPHHPIIRPDSSSTKTRIVYDASARTSTDKHSLNENLHKGTNWVEEIFAILLRFRRHNVALTADISKAFLQIGIKTEHRDALRFLWIRNIKEPPSTDNLQVFRFTRIAFGVISSPFLLHATIQHHLTTNKNVESERIMQDLYADNLVSALPPTVDPFKFYEDVKTAFATMSMNMTKWVVNDDKLRKHIPATDQELEIVQSVLGLQWHVKNDTLNIKPFTPCSNQLLLTKRHVLSDYAKIFDPLGWITPVTLLAKIYLRKLWAMKLTWDEPLSQQLKDEWAPILQELQKTNSITLKRALQKTGENEINIELHGFVDASAVACAVVVYARIQTNDTTRMVFLASKNRLTPQRELSIPRLELLALLIGARFINYVREKLKWKSTLLAHIWCDSKCVIAWTKTKRILPAMITRQLTEYHTYNITELHYVTSAQNMADVATRGATIDELNAAKWWEGPQWLLTQETWPMTEDLADIQIDTPIVTLFTPEQTEPTATIGVCSIDISKFSSLYRLIKRTAFCLKAINSLLKKKILPTEPELDYALALRYWIEWMQKQSYPHMYDTTKQKATNTRNLRLFLDDNELIRCQSRMQNANLEPNTIAPLLLGKKHHLTTLIILDAHLNNKHIGTAQTLSTIRQNYWLPQGRREVYNTIHKHCYICKKADAKCFAAPIPAPLPEFRVNQLSRPFEAAGIDIFGPLYTRDIAPNTRSGKNKRWAILFTCTVTRAVHIELLFNMNSGSIIETVKRFAARRGTPRLIVCDNAPQFRIIQNKLTNLWDHFNKSAEATTYFAKNTIQWKFLPPHAPWMGGHYERLIASIKNALQKTYGNVVLIDRQLETSLIEIESILNSRPLTYVDQNLDSPLITPNHFLNVQFPAIPLKQEKTTSERSVLALWNASQEYIHNFWKHWSEQFLLALRDRDDKLKERRNASLTIPAVNDIVLVAEPPERRSSWRLARIERLLPSADNQIRSAQLILGDNSRIIRPIIKLAPIDLKADLPPPQFELTPDRTAIIVDDQPFPAPDSAADPSTEEIEIEVELDWSSGDE